MTLYKTIGSYKKCKKKEGYVFFYHEQSKALVECYCVSIVHCNKMMSCKDVDIEAHFLLLIIDNSCFQSDSFICDVFLESNVAQTIRGNTVHIESSNNEIDIDEEYSLVVYY